MGIRINKQLLLKQNSLIEYFDYAVNKFGNKNALVDIRDKTYYTFSDIKDLVYYSAYGLNSILDNKDRIHCGIISENSAWYIISYFAIINSNNIAVLIDKDLNDETLYKQLDYADVELLFVSKKVKKRIDSIIKKCSKIKKVIILNESEPLIDNFYCTYDDLISTGKSNEVEANNYHEKLIYDSESACEILFTSGTTGANKAVMLSQKGICCSIYGTFLHIPDTRNTLAILPFHHSFPFSCHILSRFVSGTTIYINDDFLHLLKNIKEYPIYTSAVVPMVLDSLVAKIKGEVKKVNAEKYLEWGIIISNCLLKIGIDVREKFFKTIFANYNPLFRVLCVGGAPIKEETYKFLTSIGFNIVIGYGITECSPLVSSNFQNKRKKLSVGYVVPDMQIKIVREDNNDYGEILAKGDGVMLGYYKDQESTDKVIDKDGWFHTGDIGYLDFSKALHICGRLKDTIVLSNGKNIHPEEIEDLLITNIKHIKEVMVYTNNKQDGLFAKAFLHESFTRGKTKNEIKEIINTELIKFNKKMPSYKRVIDIVISDTMLIKNSTKKILREENIKTVKRIK